MKASFAVYRILGWWVFFFNILFHSTVFLFAWFLRRSLIKFLHLLLYKKGIFYQWLIIAKTWSNLTSTNRRMDKEEMVHIYTMECYLVIKKNEIVRK